jgi:TPR repeat protein
VLQRGVGVEVNHKLSLELFRRASQLGDAEAQGALAWRTAVGLHHPYSFEGASIRHFGPVCVAVLWLCGCVRACCGCACVPCHQCVVWLCVCRVALRAPLLVSTSLLLRRTRLAPAPATARRRGAAQPDEAAALLHFYFGAASGDRFSQAALGYRHTHGIGVPKSCWSAVAYYK